MEFINLDIERKVLQCLFHKKELLTKVVNLGNRFPSEAFADKSYRNVYKMIVSSYVKHGIVLDCELLRSKIVHIKLDIKNMDMFREKMLSVVDNVIDVEVSDEVINNFDIYVEELIILLNGRSIQQFQLDLFSKIDASDIHGAKELFGTFKLTDDDEGVDVGEYAADFEERETEVLKKKNNPELYKLLPTGIIPLDTVLGGGFDKEFVIISGSSNAGKSMLIEQLATNAYRLKKNVILVCIGEMNKINTANRIDCNIAGIDYKFFRNPVANYDKEIHKQWKEKIQLCKGRCGNLGMIIFRKSATVQDIMKKVYGQMHMWNIPIDGIFVDSINNISSGKAGAKEWQDYETICWELFTTTKNFKNVNGTMGIPLIATYQLKKSSKEVTASAKGRKLREDDVAFSPYPYQYSEVFIGMKNIQDEVISELQIMKGRGIAKVTGIECYHNFPYGRYHDDEKEKEVKASIPAAEKDELEEMEVET